MTMKITTEVRDAISEYYREHFAELCQFVARQVKSESEAEDIVQDVFLSLLSYDRMITVRMLPSLIYTITRNKTYDYFRRYKRYERYEQNVAACKSSACDAETVYSAWEIMRLLENGIARLDTSKAQIYRMNMFDGLAVSEISMRLSVPYKKVENRLGTARREIRAYISKAII